MLCYLSKGIYTPIGSATSSFTVFLTCPVVSIKNSLSLSREVRSGCVAVSSAECLVLWFCVSLLCDRHRPSSVHPYRVGVPVVGRTVFRLPINQSITRQVRRGRGATASSEAVARTTGAVTPPLPLPAHSPRKRTPRLSRSRSLRLQQASRRASPPR